MGIDFSWLVQLFPQLQQFLPGVGSGIVSGVISGIVLQFLNAVGTKAAKRFQTDDCKKALEMAVAQALDETSQSVILDEKKRFHFQKVFAAWLGKQNVVDELSQLIAPNQSSEIDMKLLETEFNSFGVPAKSLQRDIHFNRVVGCFIGNFRNTLAAQPELQGQIKIGLLDGLVQKTGTLIDESRKQTVRSTKMNICPFWDWILRRRMRIVVQLNASPFAKSISSSIPRPNLKKRLKRKNAFFVKLSRLR